MATAHRIRLTIGLEKEKMPSFIPGSKVVQGKLASAVGSFPALPIAPGALLTQIGNVETAHLATKTARGLIPARTVQVDILWGNFQSDCTYCEGICNAAATPAQGLALAAASGFHIVEVGAYFVTTDVLHIPAMQDYILFWTVCAVAGGPIAGCAGWAWRWGSPRAHGFGAAFLPGSFIAEAFGAYGLRLHYEPALAMFLIIGTVLFALMAWPGTGLGLIATPARGPVILAWTAAFAVAGILIYGPLLNAIVGVYSGGVYYPP